MPLPPHLLQHPGLWRGQSAGAVPASGAASGLPTGYAALDRCLPDGGWPRRGLIELLIDRHGIGELRLLLPVLAALCAGGGWLAWVSPPYQPYAPALAAGGIDVQRVLVVHAAAAGWAIEQTLRSGACSAVLGWAGLRDLRGLRRLQLAAEQSQSLAVLFRRLGDASLPSPAVLRLALTAPAAHTLGVRIVKSRGGRPATLQLELPSDDASPLAH